MRIHLRRAYLSSDDDDDMEEVILDTVPTMAPIIGGLMYIKNIDDGVFNVDKFKEAYGIDIQILQDIYNVRNSWKIETNI